MWERRPAPAAPYMAAAVCTKACAPLFPGALAPIASTGRQENGNSACRASTECEAAQLRNAVFQTDTHSDAGGRGVRTHVTYAAEEPSCTAKPEARAKRAARRDVRTHVTYAAKEPRCTAMPEAEVCGPA